MLRYYYINIQVDFETPQLMPPLPHSGKEWRSVGYFQSFYCTENSKDKAKRLVHQYFLKNEKNSSTCKIKYDRVSWMRTLTRIEDLTQGYDSDLTEEMFANRDKIGIWYSGEKGYYVSEEDYAASIMDEEIYDSDEIEDLEEYKFWGEYEGQCQACDNYGPVDDMSLCKDCSGRLDRDLIRQRDWEYSSSAFGLSDELREKLRDEVIKKYGSKLELITPSKKNKRNKSKRHQKKKRKH